MLQERGEIQLHYSLHSQPCSKPTSINHGHNLSRGDWLPKSQKRFHYSGGLRGGARGARSPLLLHQTETRRAENFLENSPHPLPQGLEPALHYCCRNNLYKVVTSIFQKLYTLFISGRNHLFRPRSHRVIFYSL